MNKYKCRTRKWFYVVPKTLSECVKIRGVFTYMRCIKIYVYVDLYFRSWGMSGVCWWCGVVVWWRGLWRVNACFVCYVRMMVLWCVLCTMLLWCVVCYVAMVVIWCVMLP